MGVNRLNPLTVRLFIAFTDLGPSLILPWFIARRWRRILLYICNWLFWFNSPRCKYYTKVHQILHQTLGVLVHLYVVIGRYVPMRFISLFVSPPVTSFLSFVSSIFESFYDRMWRHLHVEYILLSKEISIFKVTVTFEFSVDYFFYAPLRYSKML